MDGSKRIDLDKPRWDQETYMGRAKYFFTTTNPLNVFATNKQLEEAKTLVEQYRSGKEPQDTTEEQIWHAKHLYDSAFHPDTGEKNFLLGRMSFQVPGNMAITGCMITFYKAPTAVIFWQFINQSFNAIVNYTNRNASTGVSQTQLGKAYAAATSMSVFTALCLNRIVEKNPALRKSIIGRFVPFTAVAAANCVNIPLMRQQELLEGIDIYTKDGKVLGKSQTAAQHAIVQVILSRIGMAIPVMVLPPIVMNWLEKNTALLQKYPRLSAPIAVLMTGTCLSISTPSCCALFPQKSSIATSKLEHPLIQNLKKQYKTLPDKVYYNKGL